LLFCLSVIISGLKLITVASFLEDEKQKTSKTNFEVLIYINMDIYS